MMFIIIGYFIGSERLPEGEIMQSVTFLDEEVNGVLTHSSAVGHQTNMVTL